MLMARGIDDASVAAAVHIHPAECIQRRRYVVDHSSFIRSPVFDISQSAVVLFELIHSLVTAFQYDHFAGFSFACLLIIVEDTGAVFFQEVGSSI